jgi:hypothetical protein
MEIAWVTVWKWPTKTDHTLCFKGRP